MTPANLPQPDTADQNEIASLAAAARRSALSGQLREATAAYTQLLRHDPNHAEALGFFGTQALKAGQLRRSLECFQRALNAHPENASLHKNIGLVWRACGALPEALSAFNAALHINPQYATAVLHRAAVLEELGEQELALASYVTGLAAAERMGWLADVKHLPTGLHHIVNRAITVVQQARRAHLDRVLAPLRASYPPASLARVEHCLRVYLREQPRSTGDALQKCTFMHFPDIPCHAWFERVQFPWLAEIEQHADGIRAELCRVLAEDCGFQPFVDIPRDYPGAQRWATLNGSSSWNSFFFYRDGKRFDANCSRCPLTASLLDHLPLIRMAGHAPESFFSVLAPGAHIPPHTGVINIRLVAHLALIIPPDCGIRVGTETRGWKEGECIVFDDTFEHEAWNKSAHTRVVLIFDIWNPYLTEIEREAMRIVVEELGRLGRVSDRED
ncbi:MAG: aspartyl/asparaginyl beta-hydroxylase domain-containing protein [Gammaproteobacteria bacterium]|nr:aspartyl/asparaginyl beta-hydroxylase domain-containing protein [Gammaproteobacteria bacterium]MDE2140188.1 aspartyl/asparaginyl beta-hydroxylase domain-containing protein [Gammaproteobacteria bacterium]MDE2273214.1 aspartyl/asparaginyl beta-hydroxylase domain-containing protein [Gammaproteobacteria bacterium]